ncbi:MULTISPECIES: hypothetical protein [Nitratireductor]|uniref:hypothetical protein n=1 Tax=Nitratireductor TaxID=245876 RepID=UPI000D0E2535|nr:MULTISPECIES: hypothetical protein [Nitratireductor]PSM17970.1 hypothetical protein C7T96_13545 [Nitratireductor sp. StC3]
MRFREINQKFLQPASQTVMILGMVALCQPWSLFLHRYGLTIIIVGLIGFIITTHIGPGEADAEEADAERVFDVSDHREGKA